MGGEKKGGENKEDFTWGYSGDERKNIFLRGRKGFFPRGGKEIKIFDGKWHQRGGGREKKGGVLCVLGNGDGPIAREKDPLGAFVSKKKKDRSFPLSSEAAEEGKERSTIF